jgi:hypothetical protein
LSARYYVEGGIFGKTVINFLFGQVYSLVINNKPIKTTKRFRILLMGNIKTKGKLSDI